MYKMEEFGGERREFVRGSREGEKEGEREKQEREGKDKKRKKEEPHFENGVFDINNTTLFERIV